MATKRPSCPSACAPNQAAAVPLERVRTAAALIRASTAQTMRCSRYSFHRRTEIIVGTPSAPAVVSFRLRRQRNQKHAIFTFAPQDALTRRNLRGQPRPVRGGSTRAKRQYDLFAARQLIAERLIVKGVQRKGRQIFRNQFLQIC